MPTPGWGVSKSTPRGISRPSPRGISRPKTRGVSRPSPRGISRPIPRGVSRPSPRRVSRPSPRGISRPTPRGDCVSQHGLRQTPPDGYCCGRYVSYWNAFLFLNNLLTETSCCDFCCLVAIFKSFLSRDQKSVNQKRNKISCSQKSTKYHTVYTRANVVVGNS